MLSIPLEKDELIGKYISITQCRDSTMDHMKGIILDETMQMFLIQTDQKEKWIAKDIAVFIFDNDKKKSIHGSKLKYRPEERVKKAR